MAILQEIKKQATKRAFARWLEDSLILGLWNAVQRVGTLNGMTDVTQILRQIENGDPAVAERLLPLVYEELRKLASTEAEW